MGAPIERCVEPQRMIRREKEARAEAQSQRSGIATRGRVWRIKIRQRDFSRQISGLDYSVRYMQRARTAGHNILWHNAR